MTYVQFKHKFHLLHGGGKKKTKLSVGRYYLAATTIGNYALFGGGYGDGGYKATVDALDEQMTITNPTALKNARYQMGAASNSKYALFGGGRAGSSYSKTVEAYDKSLTRTLPTELYSARYDIASTNLGNWILLGGGWGSNKTTSNLSAYDISLTKKANASIVYARAGAAAASTDQYAFFGGGYNDNESPSDYVMILNTSLTHIDTLSLNDAPRKQLAATRVGDYVLFGGGKDSSTVYPMVYAFDNSLTMTTPTGLSKARVNLTATSIGYKAFFGGGEVNSTKQDVVDCYDTSLTRTVEKPLSVARYGLASASIGYKSIFAGGYGKNPSYSDAVDVYEDTRPDITVYIKVPKCVGYWIYTKTPQTFSIKAKQGMKYSDLVYSLNNSIEIPASTYTTLTLKMYIGQPAVWYKTSTSNAIAQVNVNTQSDPLLEDGATVDIFTDIQIVNQTGSGFNIGTYQ